MTISCVSRLLVFIRVVVVGWEELEIDAVCLGKTSEGLGELVIDAEVHGFQEPVQEVLDLPGMGPQQLLGCVVF